MKKIIKDNIFIIILVLLAIIVPIILHFMNNKKQDINIEIVTNYNDFYTVNSCLSRVMTYMGAKDVDSIIMTLNEKYVKNNKINKDNVLNYLSNVTEGSNFVAKKMYYAQVSENVKKFYVFGNIVLEDFDGISSNDDSYFIVYLDSKNKTFSFEPYDGSIFTEVK